MITRTRVFFFFFFFSLREREVEREGAKTESENRKKERKKERKRDEQTGAQHTARDGIQREMHSSLRGTVHVDHLCKVHGVGHGVGDGGQNTP
jgi:hypothetical protein